MRTGKLYMSELRSVVPVEIGRENENDIKIHWKDGHKSIYHSKELRLLCPCASCVEEMTGNRLLDPETVPEDVHPLKVNLVGRYAIEISWSDDHSTGIYSFETLRNICPCCRNGICC